MKLCVGVLIAVVAFVNGAAIDNEAETGVEVPVSKVLVPVSLFENAWEYQARLEFLQNQINLRLTQLRTNVSDVLRSSSNKALDEIEANAKTILELDRPTRSQLAELELTLCVNNLQILLNGITEFSGFGSSNCVTSYDNSVQEALKAAFELLQQYEGNNADVQQIVVRSFIGKNAFLQPDEIEARFRELYDERSREWNAVAIDVAENLEESIENFNNALRRCFEDIQENLAPAYVSLISEIEVCEKFDNAADPFARFR